MVFYFYGGKIWSFLEKMDRKHYGSNKVVEDFHSKGSAWRDVCCTYKVKGSWVHVDGFWITRKEEVLVCQERKIEEIRLLQKCKSIVINWSRFSHFKAFCNINRREIPANRQYRKLNLILLSCSTSTPLQFFFNERSYKVQTLFYQKVGSYVMVCQ